MLLLVAGDKATVHRALDKVRQYVAKELNLADPKAHALLWVTEFPMFEWNEDEQRYEALHHPFTAPDQRPGSNGADMRHANALAYDLVYNGVEIAGPLPPCCSESPWLEWRHCCYGCCTFLLLWTCSGLQVSVLKVSTESTQGLVPAAEGMSIVPASMYFESKQAVRTQKT